MSVPPHVSSPSLPAAPLDTAPRTRLLARGWWLIVPVAVGLAAGLSGCWALDSGALPAQPLAWWSGGVLLGAWLRRPGPLSLRTSLGSGLLAVPALAAGMVAWDRPPQPGTALLAALLQVAVLAVGAWCLRRQGIDPAASGRPAQWRWFTALLLLAGALVAADRVVGLAREPAAAVLAHGLGLLLIAPLVRAWRLAEAPSVGAVQPTAGAPAVVQRPLGAASLHSRSVLHSLGLGLSLVAALAVSLADQQTRQATFAGQVRTLAADLQGLLQTPQRDLERLRDLHYRIELDDEEFEQGGRVILRDSPWLRLFFVMPRVEAGQRTAFEASPWGLDGQALRELTAEGGLRPVTAARDHFPIRRVVPRQGNEALIGLDLAGDALLAPVVLAAHAGGRTQASVPFASLARTASDAPALLLATPVPDRLWMMGEPLTPDRVRTVIGAVVDLGWLLREARQRAGLDGVAVWLQGGDAGSAADVVLQADGRLVDLQGAARAAWQSQAIVQPQVHEPLRVADRLLRVTALAPWQAGLPQPSRAAWAVLVVGLGLTVLASASLRTRQRHLAELQAAHDGLERLVQTRTAALADSNRHLAAEVDERRRLEDDLRQASQQAHQANQAKTQFLANMSHEIRTPLNAVIGYTQILLEARDLPASARERLRTVLGAGQRLLRLINDVLDLSKIEAGGLQLHASAFDLRQECEEIERLFADRARGRGLRLHADVALAEREPVHGDRTKIGQIVMNLLSNAVKFTPQGGQVWLHVVRDGERIAITVRDDGPGIAPAELAQLFAPFRQGQAGLDQGGTGLGLALARHMARAMGGELILDSRLGAGTTAHLTLPLPPLDAAPALPPPDSADRPRRLDPATPVHAVIVEDDGHSRDILLHLLQSVGCRVEAAVNGLDGLRLIEAQRPDIVFTDIRMPVLDGLRMLGQLRAGTTALARTPVIAVSASSLEHERRHYIEQGFNDFVGKPYPFSEIHRMLAEHAQARFVDEDDDEDAAAGEDDRGPPPDTVAEPPVTPEQRTALQAMRAAAADGQLRSVRQWLQPAPDTAAVLPESWLLPLRQACQDYDVDALLRLIDERLAAAAESVPPAALGASAGETP